MGCAGVLVLVLSALCVAVATPGEDCVLWAIQQAPGRLHTQPRNVMDDVLGSMTNTVASLPDRMMGTGPDMVKSCRVVVFPEAALWGQALRNRSAMRSMSETFKVGSAYCSGRHRVGGGPVAANLSCLAEQENVYLVASVVDRMPCEHHGAVRNQSVHAPSHASMRECPSDNVRLFNSLVVFGPSGVLLAKYHKSHIFGTDAVVDEALAPRPTTFSIPEINATLGMLVCYDMEFVHPGKALLEETDVVVAASEWMNDPPFFNALMYQQAWSEAHESVLVVANRADSVHISGGGIFSHGQRVNTTAASAPSCLGSQRCTEAPFVAAVSAWLPRDRSGPALREGKRVTSRAQRFPAASGTRTRSPQPHPGLAIPTIASQPPPSHTVRSMAAKSSRCSLPEPGNGVGAQAQCKQEVRDSGGWHSSVCSTYATQWFAFACSVRQLPKEAALPLHLNHTFTGNTSTCSVGGSIARVVNASRSAASTFPDGIAENVLVVLFSQDTSEVYPNTPDTLHVQSCGLMLCVPSPGEDERSSRIHCQRRWALGAGLVFEAHAPLTLALAVHSQPFGAVTRGNGAFDKQEAQDAARTLALLADPFGEPPRSLTSAVRIRRQRGNRTVVATTKSQEPLASLALYRTR